MFDVCHVGHPNQNYDRQIFILAESTKFTGAELDPKKVVKLQGQIPGFL